MNQSQESIMSILDQAMEPGRWYEVKHLILLMTC